MVQFFNMMKVIEEAIEFLMNGGVGVMPTDTIYGLVGRASDKDAVERLYSIKFRENKPGTIIAASVEQLLDLGVSRKHIEQVQHFWPNPLSIIIPFDYTNSYLKKNSTYPAMRVVADSEIKKILEQTGPLITTSANLPGQPSATNIEEAKGYFGDKVDFYIDSGTIENKLPSTLIKVNDDNTIEIIRHGEYSLPE
jgi:L-threonylcarbamoyladenylate synthase